MIGITEASIGPDPDNVNNLLCRFTRDNFNPNSKYYNLSKNSAHVLAAYGVLQSTGS